MEKDFTATATSQMWERFSYDPLTISANKGKKNTLTHTQRFVQTCVQSYKCLITVEKYEVCIEYSQIFSIVDQAGCRDV